jgi:hypothetical protein
MQLGRPPDWNGKAVQYGGGSNGLLITGLAPLRDAWRETPVPVARGFATWVRILLDPLLFRMAGFPQYGCNAGLFHQIRGGVPRRLQRAPAAARLGHGGAAPPGDTHRKKCWRRSTCYPTAASSSAQAPAGTSPVHANLPSTGPSKCGAGIGRPCELRTRQCWYSRPRLQRRLSRDRHSGTRTADKLLWITSTAPLSIVLDQRFTVRVWEHFGQTRDGDCAGPDHIREHLTVPNRGG